MLYGHKLFYYNFCHPYFGPLASLLPHAASTNRLKGISSENNFKSDTSSAKRKSTSNN